MSISETPTKQSNGLFNWVLRLIKGILVGIGAIVPGLSGGVLMVIFGIYEPLIKFLANLKKNFIKNVLFFIPIGIGGVIGVVAFSAVIDYAFTYFAAQFIWLFIGFIAGTFPSLWKTAGKEGRKPYYWIVLVVFAVGIFFLMRNLETVNNVTMTPNFLVWIMSGAIFALGMIVPGMSPSNFLIYLGLYQPMANGIKQLDFGVIFPMMIGVVLCILVFSKLVAWLFKKAYPFMYHFILGIVVGSTAAIIPSGVTGWTIAVCAGLFVLGAAASFALAKVDEAHPHESIF
ncbi:MAG: DUF368 domain-containing protein [Anaerolineaceae bacterium]|nr:DUF368 domain-containing protein [Anaerolineaceae bacterium]